MLVKDLIKIEGFSGFQVLLDKHLLSKLERKGFIVDNKIAYCRNKGKSFGELFLATDRQFNGFIDVNLSIQLSCCNVNIDDYYKIAEFVDSVKYKGTDKKIFKILFVKNNSAMNILEIYLDVNKI